MLLTESQAGTRWCPFARTGSTEMPDAAATNRLVRGSRDLKLTGALCLGSTCMAWRPSGPQYEFRSPRYVPDPSGVTDELIPMDPAQGWEWSVDHQKWRRPLDGRLGYCGLAGKPEGA